MAEKKGQLSLGIARSTVRLNGGPYKRFKSLSGEWRTVDRYQNPGPIQFNGAVASATTITLQEEEHTYYEQLQFLRTSTDFVAAMCEPGCSAEVLSSAADGLLGDAR